MDAPERLGVHAALSNYYSQTTFAIQKGDFKGRDITGDYFYVLTVILHTVSAQTLIKLISKPTAELNRRVPFSTISVL